MMSGLMLNGVNPIAIVTLLLSMMKNKQGEKKKIPERILHGAFLENMIVRVLFSFLITV